MLFVTERWIFSFSEKERDEKAFSSIFLFSFLILIDLFFPTILRLRHSIPLFSSSSLR